MNTNISIIVAVGNDNVIGRDNQLLWHLPNDLKYFKAVTMAKPIIMGRKTFEAIGRPLPGRQNVVISRQATLNLPGVEVVHSVDEALNLTNKAKEIMVVGGAEIYRLFMAKANKIYLTRVDASLPGDAYFDAMNEDEWQLQTTESHLKDDKHAYDFQFMIYTRLPHAPAT